MKAASSFQSLLCAACLILASTVVSAQEPLPTIPYHPAPAYQPPSADEPAGSAPLPPVVAHETTFYLGRGPLDIDGDTLIGGDPYAAVDGAAGAGEARIYGWNGTNWELQSVLAAPDTSANQRFGQQVAVSGSTAVIGAPGDSGSGLAGAGAAYVFVRSGTDWVQQARLTAGDAAPNDAFGTAVAIDGDTIIAGAPFRDAGGSDRGAAYVFVRAGSTWTQQSVLTPATTAGHFGQAIALQADTLAASGLNEIAVFQRSGVEWVEQFHRLGSSSFGRALALDGDTLLVGVPDASVMLQSGLYLHMGRVDVYQRSAGVWAFQAQLTPTSTFITGFGRALDVVGPAAAVGTGYRGYVFRRDGAQWSRGREYMPPPWNPPVTPIGYGAAIGLHGARVITTMGGDADKNGMASASRLVFDLDLALALAQQPALVFTDSTFDYTFTITNNTPYTAPDVVFGFAIPAETNITGVNPSHQCNSSLYPGEVWCFPGSLAGSASQEIRIGLQRSTPGTALAYAVVSADADDLDFENNQATVTTLIHPAASANSAPQRWYTPGDEILLRWAYVSWATGYEVQIDRSSGFPAPFAFPVDSSTLTGAIVTGMPPGAYFWRVRALRPGGAGLWSGADSFFIGG